MSSAAQIAIPRTLAFQAAGLARQCSSEATRERVLVSRAVMLALREHLENKAGLQTSEGRADSLKYVELLDVCDFTVNGWHVEVRTIPPTSEIALYVPTMPLMVGVLSDFYVCVQVDPTLSSAEILGFARRADLAQAELSANGLFAILTPESLQPFETLPGALKADSGVDSAQLHTFNEWQSRADRIIKGLHDLLVSEGSFGPEQIGQLAAGLRDDLLRIGKRQLPSTGIDPLFNQLFQRFGIEEPVPSAPGKPVTFENTVEDRLKVERKETQDKYFSDQLSVRQRVPLYRHLLSDETALEEHRQIKRVLDRATGGEHQVSQSRRTRASAARQRKAQQAWVEPPAQRPQQDRNMDIFQFRDQLIGDYASYIKSFIQIRDRRINEHVERSLKEGALWPEALIQLNPSFESGGWIDEHVRAGTLHPEAARVFRIKGERHDEGRPLRLHRHQAEAIQIARGGHNYVLTTGTASGKSLAYIVPIVDHVLRHGSGRGIQAIVVYPMNALANSQRGELQKFLQHGYPDGRGPVTFARYTGQESDEERNEIIAKPPDILLTNYVMLELILTRPDERGLIRAAQGLRFLVLDELHTYRGRQGADVALLVRRVRDALSADQLQYVGTSATIAGRGTFDESRAEVAQVASQLFGAEVKPEHVVGETIKRTTPAVSLDDKEFIERLTGRITDPTYTPPRDYQSFIEDPLSVWIESTFGVKTEPDSGRLIRSEPRRISGESGAARDLHNSTGVDYERCVESIQESLLAGYSCEPNPETGFPPFAFRLHQFISRGDTVYASLEPEEERYITLNGQQYVPGSRDRVLLPLVFCRECGQEYYCVHAMPDQQRPQEKVFIPRRLNDQSSEDQLEPGFLYISSTNPWPKDDQSLLQRVPADWVEDVSGVARVRADRRGDLPQPVRLSPAGRMGDGSIEGNRLSAPFRFCLNCGVSYGPRQRDDFAKLASLGSEGRSTATTITSLSAIRSLRKATELKPEARKLLSFTDNRQDASLQAGHFNDFIEVGLLRSALYRAAANAGAEGVAHDELAQKVFDALKLDKKYYASNPEVRFQGERDTNSAFREVLGYRIYRDLRRGWRITSPNLEQCGLLEIKYPSLDEVCEAEDIWQNRHAALLTAPPEVRAKVCSVLLDFMRRELVIKVTYLDPLYQERIKQQSSQKLIEPWAIDENEQMEHAGVLFPRSRQRQDSRENVFLSARGGFGQYLRRTNTFTNHPHRLNLEETQTVIRQLLDVLSQAGMVEVVHEANDDDAHGYQLLASAMQWAVGDGTRAFHDPIRRPNEPEQGSRTNPFFVSFYRTGAEDLQGFEAREHTAQVDYDERLKREERFREGTLPILYCSPTMELGVDIAQLNVVNMRNIPPTPANYAQRSGRAGRSGQPALVFSYCSTGSPHDQYFFRRPEGMVAGAVAPPRLDLANEDLVRAHIQAIWLAESGVYLGRSLKDIIDLSGDEPTMQLFDSVKASIQSESARARTRQRAERVLATLEAELKTSDWYSERWLDEVLAQVTRNFDQAANRWRSLYLSALNQARNQSRIILDPTRGAVDTREAQRLRREAEAQLKLLTEVANLAQSDFYSYRYFASEGFLPGYNFPRLPISAYIPGRRTKQRDEFLSRPRFLALTEFGPRAVVYHEGSRYSINKVILPVGDDDLLTRRVKLCASCGYLHPILEGEGPDLCELCETPLPAPVTQLFRLQNVSTARRDKINSDEEERIRRGYEVITGLRFAEHGGRPSFRMSNVKADGGSPLARLAYGQAATIWRINLGWARRRDRNQLGFVLDTERGYWARSEQETAEDPDNAPQAARTARVIPYVEDTRNCLLLEPSGTFELDVALSLMSALKRAIQAQYQLEDNEIAAEVLPSANEPRQILFFESAEGGAGVLKRIVDDPRAFAAVAAKALEICHFDPVTGEDRRRAPGAREDCEAACYDCLMNYYNQRFHLSLDRHLLRDLLLDYTRGDAHSSPVAATRGEHLEQLLRLAGSELERRWLRYLEEKSLRLPSKAQCLVESCRTRPDFLYEELQTAIYIDGPHHDFPERQARDALQVEHMEDMGYTVIRFGYESDWDEIVAKYPNIFGRRL